MKEEILKFKEMLESKLIVRCDRTDDTTENKWKYAILCVIAEKKILGSVFVDVDKEDEESIKAVKEIIAERFDIAIKGYYNFKKIVMSSY